MTTEGRRVGPNLSLTFSMILCLGVGGIGGFATSTSVREWYPLLEKPSWTPPDSLFGPVWTALYIMMGIAAWLVWRDAEPTARRPALLIFGIQLVLNAAWSVLFFGMRNPGLAAIEIVALWWAIVATMVSFSRIRPLAAGLLAPYLAWVTFASALNFAIWHLNR
jgi:tryptophan-rich sensory protein